MIRHAVRFAHHAPLVVVCVIHQKWAKINHFGNAATDANVNGNRKGTIDSSKPCLVELLCQPLDTVEMLEYLALSKKPRGQQLTCSKSISTSRRGVSTSCIQVRPLAASSTGNTSCAYSSMERLPSHRSSATVGTAGSKSGPKYGAPFSPRVYSKAARCSRYPVGVGTLIIMGPRLYRTGRPRPLLNALQTSLGLIEANAKGTLDQSVRNFQAHVACRFSALPQLRPNFIALMPWLKTW
jgi:hypothetical protein